MVALDLGHLCVLDGSRNWHASHRPFARPAHASARGLAVRLGLIARQEVLHQEAQGHDGAKDGQESPRWDNILVGTEAAGADVEGADAREVSEGVGSGGARGVDTPG